jgi:chorismate mutase
LLARIFVVTDASREVDELRQHVARIDAQIVPLLDKRARAARTIFELRKQQPAALPTIDQGAIRELVSLSNGDMPAQPLHEIFRSIHAACLALELPVRVTFVGQEGGSGHGAARGRFGHTSWLKAAETPQSAIDDVSAKLAEFAVVPFETGAEIPVRATIDALIASELRIVEVQDIDDGPNQLRYAVVGSRPSGRTEKDLTFFIFGVDAAPGSLSRALKVLTDRGIDLKRIQSYPLRADGHGYLFCAETTGHFTDRHIVMAFEEIRRVTRFFKLLGSYPG